MNTIISIVTLLSITITINAGAVQPFATQVNIYASMTGGKFCWKSTYGRGVGVIPTGCGSKENSNGLCYDYCAQNYSGNGPLCLENCRGGYTNHPLSCYKNLFNWYFKGSYGRGAGTIPTSCDSDRENDAGLCYVRCGDTFYGVGPVCWKRCSGSTSTECGAACASDTNACVSKIFEQIVSVLQVAENVVEIVATAGGAAAVKASVKVAMQTLFKTAQKAIAKGATKEAFIKLMKSVALKAGKQFSEAAADKAYVRAASNTPFDWNDFAALDPTGIADVVLAFTNEIC